MNNRFKEIREKLNLSQEEFGNAIGIKRSGISNIESGQRTVSERHIKLLRSAFNVNEHWLRTGEGEMFNPASESLDALAEAHQLDDLTRAIIKTLITMKPAHREAFQQIVTDAAAAMRSAKYDDAQEIIANAAAHYDSALSSARARSLPEEDLPGASEPHTK